MTRQVQSEPGSMLGEFAAQSGLSRRGALIAMRHLAMLEPEQVAFLKLAFRLQPDAFGRLLDDAVQQRRG